MDRHNQTPQDDEQDLKGSLKKLALPAGLLAVGIIVVGVLFKVLILNKEQSSSLVNGQAAAAGGEVAQDAFQAPAEMSGPVQVECQSSVEKIDQTKLCIEKKSEFFSKMNNCYNYTYVIENPKSVQSEGQYGDLVFNLAECFQKESPQNTEASIEVLKKAQSLPAWEVSWGSATCKSADTINAYIESYQAESKFECIKPENIDTVTVALQKNDLSILDKVLAKDHVPQSGVIDSDVYCPTSGKELKSSLAKVLSAQIIVKSSNATVKESDSKAQVDKNDDVYIELTRGADQAGLLSFSKNQDGCLYLESLAIPYIESSE